VVVNGVRVAAWPDGVMTAAAQRLPATPSQVVEVPERLGGGFLMVIGARLWRAPSWLAPALPVFTSPMPIADVSVGLDRVYVRSPLGILAALDPRTGTPLGLGPVPASPRVVRIAAVDAWRAIALADLRGVLVTLDAGATWRPVALPFEPTDVGAARGAFSVEGLDVGRKAVAGQIALDGESSWLAGPGAAPAEKAAERADPVARIFGARPLIAALEDGWPLADGTALVARDGALGRVRLSDGELVEAVAGAFPQTPARCHPFSLGRGAHGAAFGFACGEPHGATVVYAWDGAQSRLVEQRRFDDARQVLGFDNGAVAVRGGCGPTAAREEPSGSTSWCVRGAGAGNADWAELRFAGDGADDARLVVLADGRALLVRPPSGGDLSTARLTIQRGVAATHLALRIPALRAEVARALRWGTWMDGFQERRPGVVGGWIDASGTLVGVEITADGELRAGEYVRDSGTPIASGRWALGWTGSGAGFESLDGGMTWTKEIELPVPLIGGDVERERVCGPIGCMTAGWLRIGWGAPTPEPIPEAPPARPLATRRPPAAMSLDCEGLVGAPPEVPTPRPAHDAASPRSPFAPRAVGAPSSIWGTASEVGVFAGRPPPALGVDERGVLGEASVGVDRGFRSQPLARVYAWGAASGDWIPPGRWQVRWQSPWVGWTEARSSAVSQAPWPGVDAARRAIGSNQPSMWSLAPGDDADHALLVASDAVGVSGPIGAQIVVLEADRAPVEARPASGEPFPSVEAAVRSGGRWYLATTQRAAEQDATVIWAIEGTVARELGRLPRLFFGARPALRLARKGDGRGIGVVLEGEPELDRGSSAWVAAFDVDAGTAGEPERLATFDAIDHAAALCTGDDAGWEVDLPYAADVEVALAGWSAPLQGVMARARILPNRACIARLSGSSGAYASSPPAALLSRGGLAPALAATGHTRTLDVSLLTARTRFPLRCHAR
jgi:hypothetical protein